MNRLTKLASFFAACAAFALPLSNAQAQSTNVLTFEGLSNQAQILNYYNGGQDSLPQNGTGPGFGVTFGSNPSGLGGPDALTAGSSGKFENAPPSPSVPGQLAGTGVLYVPFNAGATSVDSMNVAAGFSALSFYYSSFGGSGGPATVSIYSGLNGTGSLLQTFTLTTNSIIGSSAGTSCTSRTDEFCNWTQLSSSLGGQVGKSLVFSNADIETEFDNIAVTAAVPEPETTALMLAGLGFLAFVGRRRKKRPA